MARRLILLAFAAAWACAAADAVYVNGAVVTMDAAGRVAEAVYVRDGRVRATGTSAAMRRLAGPSARIVDLGGKALLPGFYAAHDHFPAAGVVALFQVDLNSPPIGRMKTVDDVIQALRERAVQTPPGAWIVGRGYDDTLLAERRHATRADLDRASTAHPIVVIHTSGHLNAANSRALALAGVTRDTPNPKGGVIRKDASGEPTGVIEESSIVTRHAPELTVAQRREAIAWSARHYLSRGVTTTVIAGGDRTGVEQLAAAARDNALPLRVVTMMGAGSRRSVPGNTMPGVPVDRLRVAGVKIWHDGSIQGYTGYLAAPYHRQPEGKDDYRGYSLQSRDELFTTVKTLHRAGYQVAIHGNGDAAIDAILDAFEAAQLEHPRADSRHRIEHCQTAREDQLDRMKPLGVTPSFFVGHVYYWGDRHRDIFLGPSRSARISPLASAAKRGIRFSVHDDTPVTPVNPLQLVWVAANRLTKEGRVLGPDQRIGVLRALRAVTSDAAWQNFEESTKGSIEAGKLADFVVLDRNPLAVPVSELRAINVVETIVGGERVWPE